MDETTTKLLEQYKNMSNHDLTEIMHTRKDSSQRHIAAKLLLEERREKRDRQRFHLVFWTALIGTLASIIVLFRS